MAYVRCGCGFTKENVPDEHIGKRAKCPKCKDALSVRAQEDETELHEVPDLSEPEAESAAGASAAGSEIPKRSYSEFSFLKDFNHIRWGPTYIINMIRVGSVLVLVLILSLISFTVGMFGGSYAPGPQENSSIFFMIPTFVISLLIAPISVPIATIFVRWISDKVPFGGVLHLAICIPMMLVGDPILYILKRIKPELVPIDHLKFINFTGAIFVLDDTFA